MLSKPAKHKPIKREDFDSRYVDFDQLLEDDPRFIQFDHEYLEEQGMTLDDLKSTASWDVDDFNEEVAETYLVDAYWED